MGEDEHEGSSPMRIYLTPEQMVSVDKDQLLEHWSKQEAYINWIETQLSTIQTSKILCPITKL